MHKVAVVGATGYTGGELLRLLHRHPEVELTAATSRNFAGRRIREAWPSLASDLVLEELDPVRLVGRADLVFLALPHGLAMEAARELVTAGVRVVDLGADFRLRSPAVYRQWYGKEHASPHLLASAVYGLPELRREEIRGAQLVASPGCYPTAVLLAMAPLLARGLVDPDSLIADAKSGVSGAGRSPSLGVHFCEVDENFRAYSVAGTHRHIPEMEQELSALAGKDLCLTFTPHLVPMNRGILATVYAAPHGEVAAVDLQELYRDFYRGEAFVRVRDDLPSTKEVAGSNRCDIAVRLDPRTGRIIVVSVIDNLLKGAAGQAVQAMNLVLGLPEGMALEGPGPYP